MAILVFFWQGRKWAEKVLEGEEEEVEDGSGGSGGRGGRGGGAGEQSYLKLCDIRKRGKCLTTVDEHVFRPNDAIGLALQKTRNVHT